MKVGLQPTLACIALVSLGASACSPEFPNYYVALGNEYRVLEIVAPGFPQAYCQHVDPQLKPDNPIWRWAPKRNKGWRDTAWGQTLSGDASDLHAALAKLGMATEARATLLLSYRNLRGNMYLAGRAAERDAMPQYSREWQNELDPIAPFKGLDNQSMNTVLTQLPEEFALYAAGAWAYRRGDTDEAMQLWDRLLALPEEGRRYRSTWAAYMMGKAWLDRNPAQAIVYFEETRAFANRGFRDTLQLTKESQGWQACAESRAGRHADALRRYAGLEDHLSLRTAVARALSDATIDAALVEDPLCRELLIAGLEAYLPDMDAADKVYSALEKLGDEATATAAGNIARRCYMNGHYEDAGRWVEKAPKEDAVAQWVRSKLLLREGKIDEAVELLKPLVTRFPTEDTIDNRHGLIQELEGTSNRICSELGTLLLGREEYIASLDTLMRGKYWADAAYVAEYVLTIEELGAYIEAHAEDPALTALRHRMWDHRAQERSAIDALRYLYARRLARNGDWEAAALHCPDGITFTQGRGRNREEFSVKALYPSFESMDERLADPNLAPQERAGILMSYAGKLRRFGMELSGSTLTPDWQLFHGIYKSTTERWILREQSYPFPEEARRPTEIDKALKLLLAASQGEQDRMTAHLPVPNETFHYRYRAADLMWEAASLLPDNDPMTARALCFGGDYLKTWDPEAADRFYKALVRRCPNLQIGKDADQLRWFPPKPGEWGPITSRKPRPKGYTRILYLYQQRILPNY